MLGFHAALAHVERRTEKLVDPEHFKSDTTSNNVDNCVDSPDFMKMNFFERNSVDASFRVTQLPKDGGGPFPDARRELSILDQGKNCGQRTVMIGLCILDVDVRGAESIPQGFFRSQVPIRQSDTAQFVFQFLRIASGIDQPAKDHVPADPRKAIE